MEYNICMCVYRYYMRTFVLTARVYVGVQCGELRSVNSDCCGENVYTLNGIFLFTSMELFLSSVVDVDY